MRPSACATWAVAVTLGLLALRFGLAELVGFGDAEALYASYALHPQPAYLDHPGLVGTVARLLGGGGAPSPLETHRFTALLSAVLPGVAAAAALASGADRAGALRAFFAIALLPQLVIGSFALTPDLLLAFFWLAALGAGAYALRASPGSKRALFGALFAGAFVGFACLSKVTGVLLALGMAIAWGSGPARAHLRTPGPFLAALLAAVLVAPAGLWEATEGFPMLRHRLIATQHSAGFSLRNLGALVGGQLLYVTPPFLYAGWLVLRRLRRADDDPARVLLWTTTWVAFVPLAILCLWSSVAEPHWIAPAVLGVAIHAARVPESGGRLGRICAGTGIAVALVGFVWVGTGAPVRLLGAGYVPRYDLSNDLYAWKTASRLVQSAVDAVRASSGRVPVVVGPHYVVCAQVHAALGSSVPVGCRTPVGDDFGRWYPEARWQSEPELLFVHDDRFEVAPSQEFPGRAVADVKTVDVVRGGRRVRTVTVTRLVPDAGIADVRDYSAATSARRPAISRSSVSESRAGFGVVSSCSP